MGQTFGVNRSDLGGAKLQFNSVLVDEIDQYN